MRYEPPYTPALPIAGDLRSGEARRYLSILWFALSALGYLPTRFDAALQLFDHANDQIARINQQLMEAMVENPKEEGGSRSDRMRQLMDDSRDGPPYKQWLSLAASQGALMLFDTLKHTRHAQLALERSEELRAAVDPNLGIIQAAIKSFSETFPTAKAFRDAIAHEPEILNAPENNSTRGNFFIGNLIGRRYETTGFGGERVGYELDSASSDRLKAHVDQVFRAFPPPR